MQPVLEMPCTAGFDLWPVAELPPYGFLALGGGLGPGEVGAAVLAIAAANDVEPEHGRLPRPDDPLRGLLHGLFTVDPLFAPGGLRVTDTATGVTLVPGCCNGLDERGDWRTMLDCGSAGFGHDPSPLAERLGDTVRLTVDAEADDSPRIELPVTQLRELLAGAESDLHAFHAVAGEWARAQLPDVAQELREAIGKALALH
ncbi:hypothetical protein [Streptomyces sp. Da 82-17]|uniref:hypothetical protein n=1 Tax=Streptomyces sp. Da 82-17 TaxID=3377116 RepID=UPI0038D3B536